MINVIPMASIGKSRDVSSPVFIGIAFSLVTCISVVKVVRGKCPWSQTRLKTPVSVREVISTTQTSVSSNPYQTSPTSPEVMKHKYARTGFFSFAAFLKVGYLVGPLIDFIA